MDDLRIHSAYKNWTGKFPCYRFIVAAGVLYNSASLTSQFSDKFVKRLEMGAQVGSIDGFTTTVLPGMRIAIVLLRLEILIHTVFMFIKILFLN